MKNSENVNICLNHYNYLKKKKDLAQATAFHMQTFPVHNFINPTFPRII